MKEERRVKEGKEGRYGMLMLTRHVPTITRSTCVHACPLPHSPLPLPSPLSPLPSPLSPLPSPLVSTFFYLFILNHRIHTYILIQTSHTIHHLRYKFRFQPLHFLLFERLTEPIQPLLQRVVVLFGTAWLIHV